MANGGAYSGAWQRAQFYSVPGAVHTTDPAHERRGQQGDPQAADWTAERVNLPPGLPYYVDPEADDAQIITEGLDFDRTDYMRHDHRGTHDEDLGAARAQNYTEKTIRGPGEAYANPSVPSFGPENMQPTDENLRRGVNSHPMNNPGLVMYDGKGFRYGTWEFPERGRLRAFLSRVVRTDHGVHPLYPNTVYAPPQARYSTAEPLWRSLARSIDQTQKRPMLRRTPPTIAEVIEDDGGPTADDSYSLVEAGF